MARKGKTDEELWEALQGLEDDLLDPNMPEDVIDDELKALGINPAALARRGTQFVHQLQEEQRLSWQEQAKERRAELEARAANARKVPQDMDNRAVQARLSELRATDAKVGTAIKMAARKRKAEETSEEDARLLLEEAEALRAMEEGDDDSE